MEGNSTEPTSKPLTIRKLTIENFRGIRNGEVDFFGHSLLLGGNNVGKSTICEALELVLGPERVYRRPIVDEHDFYNGRYLNDDGSPVYIKIDIVLLNLPDELDKRLSFRTRPWCEKKCEFVDIDGASPSDADSEHVCAALPLTFIGYYDRVEDDFKGNTYFAHPVQEVSEEDEDFGKPFAGLSIFGRELKLKCGFIYLRTLRTGRRALSLERGSLLDTILRLGDTGKDSMWESTLNQLRDLDPPIGKIPQLENIQDEIRKRMVQLVGISADSDATGFFVSDLTREHLRKVVQLFLKSQVSNHSIPFNRLGTGSINALVFALLTHIADLRDERSIIFAMEEPEIALPPYSQRRIIRYLLKNMGQAIITSHSPIVIEEFDVKNSIIVGRDNGTLHSDPILIEGIRPSLIRKNRKQLAEAVLSKGIIVAEGDTEVKLLEAATYKYEELDPDREYIPLDLVGVSIFNAESQGSVPKWAPFFKALKKTLFAFQDKPKEAWKEDQITKLNCYQHNLETDYTSVEDLLVAEVPVDVLRRFLESVSVHPENTYIIERTEEMADEDVKKLSQMVLKNKKGAGFAALVIEACEKVEDLPETVRKFLEDVNEIMISADLGDTSQECKGNMNSEEKLSEETEISVNEPTNQSEVDQ